MTKIRLINKSPYQIKYATEDSAGMDLCAFIDNSVILEPLERKLISTGLFMELPQGFEAMVRPRSGLALKHGITVLNTPGTIDADYRGEIGVILINLSHESYTINPGDRIAQMVINQYTRVEIEITEQLSETVRGSGGFGHSGK